MKWSYMLSVAAAAASASNLLAMERPNLKKAPIARAGKAPSIVAMPLVKQVLLQKVIALSSAADKGQVETVRQLLADKAVEVIDRKNEKGWGALHYAAWRGHGDVVKILLENNANANLEGKSGTTPLHIAAEHGHIDVVILLLSRTPWLDVKNIDGATPLHIACEKGHVEVVRLLCERHADVCNGHHRHECVWHVGRLRAPINSLMSPLQP